MKISYYKVYEQKENSDEDKKEKIDINFKDIVDNIIKNQHAYSSEFIAKILKDVYVFVKINSTDLIKKINTQDLSVTEIQSILDKDESIGFSSYFIIKNNIIGYGPTLLSAKINRFYSYINSSYMDASNGHIIFEPICKNVTAETAMKLEFIGKTTIKVEAKSSGVLGFFGISGVNEELLDCLEITIKPKRGKNIKKLTQYLIENKMNEIEKMKFMAKEEMADHAVELYLDENILCDHVDHKVSSEIPFAMESRYQNSKKIIKELLKQ
ncbi:hypothetical protein A9G09_11970 [Gilliamella sp. wkB292]|uniref:hypothetical protein n=1 Tax=unclassified Gilliamella TaxID=2685620 RepID=UPI00080DA53C|nr:MULTISPECIES: hypothetical protein [Gilliamella]MCX8729626.1 hypothetical protein [Gilliamella sp. B2969]OCG10822.1 hypothetical protein A9G09_11970 [Gilliamella apicola]